MDPSSEDSPHNVLWKDVPASWNFFVSPLKVGRSEAGEQRWCVEGPLGVDHWGLEFSFPSGICVNARYRWEKESFEVTLQVEGDGIAPCARCLSPTPLAIRSNFVYFFLLRHGAGELSEEDAETEEHLVVLDRWPEKLQLSLCAWESLVAELPSRVLCNENCLGLCPSCGANRNQETCSCQGASGDPRFLKLVDRPIDRG